MKEVLASFGYHIVPVEAGGMQSNGILKWSLNMHMYRSYKVLDLHVA